VEIVQGRIELFIIREDDKRGALRVAPRVKPKGGWPSRHFLTGRSRVTETIDFAHDGGARPVDWLFAAFSEYMVISTKFRDVLLSADATGWIEYPVRVFNAKKRVIPGYHGIHITGECGPPHWERSARVVRGPSVLLGPRRRSLRGFVIDTATWDGKDLVVAEGETTILASPRLAGILSKAGLSNVSVQSVHEYEADESNFLNSLGAMTAQVREPPASAEALSSTPGSSESDFHVFHHILEDNSYVWFTDRSQEILFREAIRQGGPSFPKSIDLVMEDDSEGDDWLTNSMGQKRTHIPKSPMPKSRIPRVNLDSLNIGHTGHALVSTRVLSILLRTGATGWREYRMTLVDPRGRLVKGYHGLQITGRSGPLDWKGAQRVHQYHTSSRTVWARKAPSIDPKSWDGSDLFIPEGIPWRLASGRVGRALRAANLSNFESLPLTEFEMMESTVWEERKK
jgi:hypothetical protein